MESRTSPDHDLGYFTSTPVQHSKAAHLPEELFESIIRYACARRWPNMLHHGERAAVSVLGQVCRYWARLARRGLFRNIALRTLGDVNSFYNMLSSPTPRGLDALSDVVLSVSLQPRREDAPWLHLFFLRVRPLLNGLGSTVPLNVDPEEKQEWHSLHPSLPRAIPGSIMPLSALLLIDVYFADGRALSRLLASLPLLKVLSIIGAKFEVQPTAQDFPATRSACALHRVGSDNFRLSGFLVPLMIASGSSGKRSRRVPKDVLAPEDLEANYALLNVFASHSTPARRLLMQYEPAHESKSEIDSTYSTHHALCICSTKLLLSAFSIYSLVPPGTLWVAPFLKVYLSPMNTPLHVQPNLAAAPQQHRTLHVQTLELQPDHMRGDPASWVPCDEFTWMRFASAALRFPRLETVRIVRRAAAHASKPAASAFGDASPWNITTEAFASLVDAHKLVCMYVDAKRKVVRTVNSVDLRRPRVMTGSVRGRANSVDANATVRQGHSTVSRCVQL